MSIEMAFSLWITSSYLKRAVAARRAALSGLRNRARRNAQQDSIADLLTELERERGAINPRAMEEVRNEWPDSGSRPSPHRGPSDPRFLGTAKASLFWWPSSRGPDSYLLIGRPAISNRGCGQEADPLTSL